MVRTAAAASRREERTERRQAQILGAARTCVRLEGFHAASMSRIAAEASMSVGHIYRYFESKDAIMIALCENDFEEFMLHITQLDEPFGWDVERIIERFVSRVPWLLDHDQAGLALEVLAEAGRNPKVAALVIRVDDRFREAIRTIIGSVLKDLTDQEIDERAELMLMLTRALALHAGTHPVDNAQAVAAGFELALKGVLLPRRLFKPTPELKSA